MSIHVISKVFGKKWGSPSRKIVAIKLADVANEDGTSIYPALQTIADECELSRKQVKRIVKGFEAMGPLVKVRQGGFGPKNTTEYRFDLDAIDALEDVKSKVDKLTPIHSDKGDICDHKGDTHDPQPVLLEPSYSLREESEPKGSGANAPQGDVEEKYGGMPPTTSKLIWDEGIALISSHSQQPINKVRSLIGKWNKRASSEDEKEKLLAIIRGAAKAGTHDPVSYITKAVNEAWPPPLNPKDFTHDKWVRIAAHIIGGLEWSDSLGPVPGSKGCAMPADLVTPELIKAAQGPDVEKLHDDQWQSTQVPHRVRGV